PARGRRSPSMVRRAARVGRRSRGASPLYGDDRRLRDRGGGGRHDGADRTGDLRGEALVRRPVSAGTAALVAALRPGRDGRIRARGGSRARGFYVASSDGVAGTPGRRRVRLRRGL